MQLTSIYTIETIAQSMESFLPLEKKTGRGRPQTPYTEIARAWLQDVPKLIDQHSWPVKDTTWYHLHTEMVRKAFRYEYKAGTKYVRWFNWFHTNYPHWKEIEKGNNMTGRATLIQKLIHSYESNKNKEFGSQLLNHVQLLADKNADDISSGRAEFTYQRYNLDSLNNYIQATEDALNSGKGNAAYREVLQRNVDDAVKILTISDPEKTEVVNSITDNQITYSYFPVLVKRSNFGREYHLGLCLQNCSRELRTAALGRVINIDISTSVFAYYKQLYETLFDREVPLALDMMLENKRKFRERIANDISEANDRPDAMLKRVKLAITAIGFGARTDNYTVALKDAFGYTDRNGEQATLVRQLKAFKEHEYIQQLSTMSQELQAEFRRLYKSDPEFKALVQQKILGGYDAVQQRVNYPKILAYYYQQAEQDYRNEMIRVIQEMHEGEVVLQTHDGIYVRGGRDLSEMGVNVQWSLQQLNPYLKVALERFNGYGKPKTDESVEADPEDHEQLIQQEEQRAKGYAPVVAQTGLRKPTFEERARDMVYNDYVKHVSGQADRELEQFHKNDAGLGWSE